MVKSALTRGAALAAALISSYGGSALASEYSWYLSPMLSYDKGDEDRQADNDVGLHLGVGTYLNERWNVEISAVADTLDASNGPGAYKQRGLIIDGLYFFSRDAGLSVYGVVGLGALRTELSGDKATNGSANVGLGFMAPVNDAIGLRSDIRYRIDNDDRVAGEERFGDLLFNVGLYIPFGGTTITAAAAPEPEPAPEPVVAPVDSDGDGVADSADRCPNSLAGINVDASGCEVDSDGDGISDSRDACPGSAAGVSVDGRGCERDGDNDGVVDSRDRCPATPAHSRVDAEGCIPDSDGDGVADNLDRCPATAPGTQVDGKGCELEAVIVLKGVHFETGSARLTAASAAALDEIVTTMKRYPGLVIEVGGHTDSQGAEGFNQRLSAQRAQAVVDYLVGHGIDGSRLKAKGYGSSQPVADNATAAGRAKNRRVELQILQR